MTYQVNMPLTNYSVGWYSTQVQDLSRIIAPNVQAPSQVGTFKRYDRGTAFDVHDTRRPLYNAPKTVDIEGEDIPYLLEDHGLETGIDDRQLRGAINPATYKEKLRLQKTNRLLQTMLRSHNKQVFDIIKREIAPVVGIGDWSSSTAKPVTEMKDLRREFTRDNGLYPTTIMMGDGIWDYLEENAQIMDKIQYNETQTLTESRLLQLLGLVGNDIPPVRIVRSILSYNKNEQGAKPDNMSLLENELYMFYASDNPTDEDLTAVKTLTLGGDNFFGEVTTARDGRAKTDWIQVGLEKQIVVAAPSCIKRIIVT